MEPGVIAPLFWLGNRGPCDAFVLSDPHRPSSYLAKARRSVGEDRNTSRVLPPFVYAARRCRTVRTLPLTSYTSSHLRLVSSFARSPSPSEIASVASARAEWRVPARGGPKTFRAPRPGRKGG